MPAQSPVSSPVASPVASPVQGSAGAAPTERIVNGDFGSALSWTTAGSSWSIGSGVATDPNGIGYLKQVFAGGSVSSGTSVALALDVTLNTAACGLTVMALSDAGGTVGALLWTIPDGVSVGHQSTNIVLGATCFGIAINSDNPDVGFAIAIDNVSFVA